MANAGLTQTVLAELMGVSQPTVGQLISRIRNKKDILPKTAGNLSRALGVPVDFLAIIEE